MQTTSIVLYSTCCSWKCAYVQAIHGDDGGRRNKEKKMNMKNHIAINNCEESLTLICNSNGWNFFLYG